MSEGQHACMATSLEKRFCLYFKKNKLYNREKYLRQLRLFIRIWLNLCIVPEIPKERERNAYILPQQ